MCVKIFESGLVIQLGKRSMLLEQSRLLLNAVSHPECSTREAELPW